MCRAGSYLYSNIVLQVGVQVTPLSPGNMSYCRPLQIRIYLHRKIYTVDHQVQIRIIELLRKCFHQKNEPNRRSVRGAGNNPSNTQKHAKARTHITYTHRTVLCPPPLTRHPFRKRALETAKHNVNSTMKIHNSTRGRKKRGRDGRGGGRGGGGKT